MELILTAKNACFELHLTLITTPLVTRKRYTKLILAIQVIDYKLKEPSKTILLPKPRNLVSITVSLQ